MNLTLSKTLYLEKLMGRYANDYEMLDLTINLIYFGKKNNKAKNKEPLDSSAYHDLPNI